MIRKCHWLLKAGGRGREHSWIYRFRSLEKLCGKLGVRGAIRKLHDEIINQRQEKRRNGEWLMARRGMRGGGWKKEAWNVSPVGERSCVKGNSKFTGGVLAEADEKFRENNDKIKRRNVCTHVAREPWAFLPSLPSS